MRTCNWTLPMNWGRTRRASVPVKWEIPQGICFCKITLTEKSTDYNLNLQTKHSCDSSNSCSPKKFSHSYLTSVYSEISVCKIIFVSQRRKGRKVFKQRIILITSWSSRYVETNKLSAFAPHAPTTHNSQLTPNSPLTSKAGPYKQGRALFGASAWQLFHLFNHVDYLPPRFTRISKHTESSTLKLLFLSTY